jgi:archaellum biogenesis protein FlaJ (TadC family)
MEAVCDETGSHCRLLPTTPYAEISILSVVTAGVSAIACLGYGHHIRRTPPAGVTYLLLFLSIMACISGIAMYVVATVGALDEKIGWATWATLAAALAASLSLSLERA